MALIVLADGDPGVRRVLAPELCYRGHLVREVGSTREILHEITEADVDMVILDVDLPDLSGDTALRAVRRVSNALMIAITDGSDERRVVTALRAGADHCITKPVSASHLSARVTALLRRTGTEPSNAESVLEVGDLRIERNTRTASLGGAVLDLRRLEFDLLAYLATHAGSVVTRQDLFKNVWRRHGREDKQTIDVHVCWLRRKLGETARAPRYLRTVRGIGFIMPVEP